MQESQDDILGQIFDHKMLFDFHSKFNIFLNSFLPISNDLAILGRPSTFVVNIVGNVIYIYEIDPYWDEDSF